MARTYVEGNVEFVRCGLVLVNMFLPDGTRVEKLSPRRLFPTSDAEHYISLLDADGHEHAIVCDIAELSQESAEVLRDVLREYYIIPKITAVLDIQEKGGGDRWMVMTDRGKYSFQIQSRLADVKSYDGGRILFRDASDNRYEIPDWTKLDRHSRHLLNPYV